MTQKLELIGLFAICQIPWQGAIAQTPTAPTLTVEDTIASLRTYAGSAGTFSSQVLVSNYASANDGGGGMFSTDGSPCAHAKTIASSVGWTSGNPTFTYSTASFNIAGLYTYGSGATGIRQYDLVISQDTIHSTVTLASPPIGSSSGTIMLSCDNGGSVIGAVSGTGGVVTVKYTRQNSNYTPQEWGAQFNSGSDDAFALTQWLNGSQRHLGSIGTTYIGSPLICPDQVAIEGPAGPGVAEDASIIPPFVIAAASAFNGGMMLLMPSGMSCAIHDVGIIAPSNKYADGVDAFGKSDLVDKHSYISNGYVNVRSGSPGPGGGAANLAILESSLNNAGNINALINSPNARLIGNSFAGSGGLVSPGVTGSSTATLSSAAAAGATILSFTSFALPIPSPGMAVSGTNVDNNAVVANVSSNTVTLTLQTLGIIAKGSIITFAAPTGENIRFSSTDGLIMGNIIQQAAGDGVFAKSARSLRVLGNFLDNNGKMALGTGAVAVSNSGHVSVVGNTMAENGAADELASASGTVAYPAHVHFNGTNDNVILSGNVYIPLTSSGNNSTGTNSGPSAVLLHPDFVYDVAPGSTFSNTIIADDLSIQNLGVLTPEATPFLSSALVTRAAPNYNSGITVSPASGAGTFTVSVGAVMDSTNQVLITAGTACLVNLNTEGNKGRDSGTSAVSGTYDVFIIAGLNGANPSCVASLNPTPSFANFATAPIVVNMPGMLAGGATSGTAMIFNIGSANANNILTNPLSGLAVGDTITSTSLPVNGTVAAVQAFNLGNVAATIAVHGTTYNTGCINSSVSVAAVGTFWASAGMGMAGTGVPANTTIFANGTSLAVGGGGPIICGAGQQVIVTSGTTGATGDTSISFGGNFSVFLSGTGSISPVSAWAHVQGCQRLLSSGRDVCKIVNRRFAVARRRGLLGFSGCAWSWIATAKRPRDDGIWRLCGYVAGDGIW